MSLLAFHSEETGRTRTVPVFISARPSAHTARLGSCSWTRTILTKTPKKAVLNVEMFRLQNWYQVCLDKQDYGKEIPLKCNRIRAWWFINYSHWDLRSLYQDRVFGVSLAMEEDSTVPDFREIEVKLGRKVPESLARSITHRAKPLESSRVQGQCTSSELQQLESKMLFLKQEMVSFYPLSA